jgi:hypothetical protein
VIMFTIDLLKGQGLPVRTKPQGVALFVATFAVPALIAILMVGYYFHNAIIISVHKQNITNFETRLQRLTDALELKESFEKERATINTYLSDVAVAIRRHAQWSPVLVALVENLPDSIILNSLEVKRSTAKGKVAVAGAPGKKVDSNVSVRTLKMRVSGNPNYNCDIDVKAFRERLLASKVLGPRLEDVVIAAQGYNTMDGEDVVAYDIDCVFKPGF